ncbi:hypothetical protein [Paraburkholderia terricola]|uniref:Uncharacterized protein n=1 Tax=Paraburkholderia terricola TaxID=169427 RepID=A0A1M6XLP6_9BURK|nr:MULTISPECIES: hypothetical protein [Paraburkholderia]SDP29550.1 hypothetical protein SAMN05192547_105724 [Paraburkholderia sediminicola]SHL06871.1 hypothetical protein SAMN05192548_105723 [Paraburkholderia terricola]
MFKRLSARKSRAKYASRVKRTSPGKTIWSKLEPVGRHPLTVVTFGFVLSTLFGTWITHRLDHQQKEREAITRNFDAVRAATDDLTVAMARYQTRTLHLLDQIVVSNHTTHFDNAANDYEAAYVNWVERSAADQAVILQMYQGTSVFSSVQEYFRGFEQNSAALDACARMYLAFPNMRAGIAQAEITCHTPQPNVTFQMSHKMLELGFCVRVFVAAARPFPKIDFMESDFRDAAMHQAFSMAKGICWADTAGFLHARD